jgi:hypothetical protein
MLAIIHYICNTSNFHARPPCTREKQARSLQFVDFVNNMNRSREARREQMFATLVEKRS